MSTTDKTDRIVFWIFIAVAILLIGVLLGIRLEQYNQSVQQTDAVSEMPEGYHQLYDDENNVIIAPSEYHFVVDQNGSMVLSK